MYENITDHEILYSPIDAFNTHRPFLKYYLKHTTGDIIEFGTGYGSTPIIRELIKGTNRKLLSFENNSEWYKEISERYPENENHKYFFSTNWEKDIPLLTSFSKNISICFVDSAPWESRVLAMNCFKDISQYIMVHDVDYFNNNNIFGTSEPNEDPNELPTYKYDDISNNWALYYPKKPYPYITGPPTLTFSNTGHTIFKFN